ncbi:hypothetical protein E2986_12009 [Frieseomelitta varia]|uniref:E3 ubiquitin-protein ligase listerin n=1 Tax=Frieseomelitta varia TaxID=561572 RepID=A0A833W3L9_9HYME|nr:hypothetical protein E2986_12009 [Frieseomelitta varia]
MHILLLHQLPLTHTIIDIILRCQHKILSHICDNLIVHSALTLSQRYDTFLRQKRKKIPIQKVEKMIELNNKITSSNKLWNLNNTDAVPFKTAYFALLPSMIDINVILQNEKKRTVTCIVNSIDEIYPELSSGVWKSIYTTTNKIKDWYSVIDIEKLLLPKFWCVLQNSGQCCASIIYPFSVQSIQTNDYEALAVTTSFIECFGYYILSNINNRELINALLREQFLSYSFMLQ